jgi:hypothetical protein
MIRLFGRGFYKLIGSKNIQADRVARWHILNRKCRFGKVLEGLAMEDGSILYAHLVYFVNI